jgi:lipopolysaccharide/colanic/teichoic acid biosynthesis glycosyltransferase
MLTVKRIFDVVVASSALFLLTPLFLVLWLVIKMDDRGPLFYVDERVGKRGQCFDLYKFRSMVVGAEHIGLRRATTAGDPRITPIGALLRRWSLDELPQVLNVLKGDMSIVGPRPTIPSQVADYTAHQLRRLEMRPGLTGWAQINGRNALTWTERIELDICYIENWSLLLDLRIILKTPLVLLRREGIYGPEGVTLDFKGQ